MSSRSYQQQRECGYSLEQFGAVFPTAEVLAPAAQLLRTLGHDLAERPRVIELPTQITLPTQKPRPDPANALVGPRHEVNT